MGYTIEDLRLLTTSRDYPGSTFEIFGDTSAAAANAARLCATVRSRYPDLWPESIRALLVDSAAWTEAMLDHLPPQPRKIDYGLLLKRYGFGVPSLERALSSASNALTLVAEETIRPYIRNENNRVVLNEMKLFRLPWPLDALRDLGNTEVHMRVTLSYFIEPNPAENARKQEIAVRVSRTPLRSQTSRRGTRRFPQTHQQGSARGRNCDSTRIGYVLDIRISPPGSWIPTF